MIPIIPTIAHKVSVNWTWMPPFGYPDASKKAAGILAAKIKDILPKVKGSI